ncbi:MAG: Lactose transport system permease protein LacF [Chloroflexi bacterium ADurb.Bin325]|nr:MAG: Lactose transport system permease protein LacF [Chloroflexi bacterium ADurb.Bin325]
MGFASLKSRQVRQEFKWGLLFITPWIVGFLLFQLYPTLASLYYSFTDKALVRAPEFVGFDNYVKLLTRDKQFIKALSNTLYMVAIQVPLGLIFAFFTALLLNMKIRGQAVFRTVYYLPTVVPAVAGTLLWLWILNPRYGIMNQVLQTVGLRSPAWFGSPVWAKPAMIMMGLWAVGTNTVLYLAALQGVPQEMYESATLDGANWWQRTLRITVPMVSPVTLFIAITSIIGTFQLFTQAYIVAGSGGAPGSPRESLLFYAIYLYHQGFVYLKMGYASALAWILFIIIMVVTLVLMRSSARYVYYES